MKIKYIPGTYPVPMLMYYREVNKLTFEEIKKYDPILIIGEFTNQYSHIWNMGSYIIYDDSSLEVKSSAIGNFANFVWLLRIIAKELVIEIDEDSWLKILNQEEGKSFAKEFQIISK